MKKKLLLTAAVVMCAVLLVVGSIAGTVAYLRAEATITNSFTYGTVKITLDEAYIDPATGDRPTTGDKQNLRVQGNQYKLVAGKSFVKDPIIHISSDSEDSFLFVKIDMSADLAKIQVSNTNPNNDTSKMTIAQQLEYFGWKSLQTVDGYAAATYANIYYYAGPTVTGVNPAVTDDGTVTIPTDSNGVKSVVNVTVFDHFNVGSQFREADFTVAARASFSITAYAVQGAEIASIKEAANVFFPLSATN